MTFVITSEHHKMRLDKFLKEHFPDLSRAYLQKLIEAGNICVNGKAVAVHHFLKEGDEVAVTIEPPQEIVMIPNPEVGFEVIHEDPDFIVINKPTRLVVHQGVGHKAPDTLANGLISKYPEIAKVGDDPVRPGMAHRLDADVSGVMVVARTQDMFDHLKKQFRVHEVEKEYVAVVEGGVSPSEGTIEFALARKGVKMVARPKHEQGKRAITEYEVIEHENIKTLKYESMTLLKIVTRTGRTHQIRVHLKAKGWPIVGDELYKSKIKNKKSNIGESKRLMLHAKKLSFKDLAGHVRTFIAKIPPEFENF